MDETCSQDVSHLVMVDKIMNHYRDEYGEYSDRSEQEPTIECTQCGYIHENTKSEEECNDLFQYSIDIIDCG